MALARLALKNLGQRVVVVSPSCYSVLVSRDFAERSLDTEQKQRWGSDLLRRGLSTTSSGHDQQHEKKSEGREVTVSDKSEKKKFSLFPRKQRKRRGGLWRNNHRNFELFPTGLGNALVQATETLNKLLQNLSPSRLMDRYKEDDECYKLTYFMPGLRKEDVKITVEERILKIRAEHREEEQEESDDEFWATASYGYYDYMFVLPEDAKADEIKAEMKDGVLTIIIPRIETEKKDVKEVQID